MYQIAFTYLLYQLNRRIPERQFISAWLDNHHFMLEKHIYSNEFLQFLKDLICMVEKPKDYIPSLTLQSIIYKNYDQIPEEDQKLYYSTLQMCAKLFFNIFYKSFDFEILKDLLCQMKALLDLIPQYTYQFAQEFIFSRFKQFESVLTSCLEPTVRSTYSQILVFTFNNLINFYNIQLTTPSNYFVEKEENNLTQAELAERDILNFLDRLLDIMHTEVSKNWLRMQQYLEIFRDFSYGGDAQATWCFNYEMIARLIDLFLGNISPLDCYGRKKHEIGNRFVATPFGPLIQCVSFLISKVKWNINSQKVYQFSDNEQVALNNWEFYWKAMQENYDSQSICYIGQFMSHKDKIFSQNFGRLILKGINKASCDHIKQYLDLMSSYLAINDEYQQNRIEWIFGYANLKCSYKYFFHNKQFKKFQINPNDGYEMKLNLDEQIVNYETKLKCDNIQSVLNTLYYNRKIQENLCLHILHRVLLMCKNDQFYRFLNYMMKIPAPSYCCAHYLSWVRPHLESIINDQSKNYVGNQKEETAKACLQIYEEIEKIINQYANQKQDEEQNSGQSSSIDQSLKSLDSTNIDINSDQPKKEFINTQESTLNIPNFLENGGIKSDEQKQSASSAIIQENQENGLKSLWTNYIVGKTVSVEENTWMPIGEDSKQEEVYLREMEYSVFYTESHPTGSSNQVFPEKIRYGTTIILSSINLDESNISDFLYIHNPNSNGSNNQNNQINKNSPKDNGNNYQNNKKEEENSPSFNSANYYKNTAHQYLQNIIDDAASKVKVDSNEMKLTEYGQKFAQKFEGNLEEDFKNEEFFEDENLIDNNLRKNQLDEDADDEDENNSKKNKKGKHRQNLLNLNIQTKQIHTINNENQKIQNQNNNQQLYEMQEIKNQYVKNKGAFSDSSDDEVSIDSNKAHVGEDFSLSGLPSATNCGQYNMDDRNVENSENQTVIVENQEKKENINQQSDQHKLIEFPKIIELKEGQPIPLTDQDQANQQSGNKLNSSSADPNYQQQQQSQALVVVNHILNVKKQIGNVIRRFLIDNSTDSIARVQIQFTLEDENTKQLINQHMPYEILIEVEPKSTATLFSMRKINPQKQWSKYTITAECEFSEVQKQEPQQQSQNTQQKSNQKNQQPEQSSFKKANQNKPDSEVQEQADKPANFIYEDDFQFNEAKIGPQLPNKQEKDYSGFKACPVCTFEQIAINNICEMCDSSLN